jgi:hypothetical protein
VGHYNKVRLHSAIGYVTPADKLEGRDKEIFAERDSKLEYAREQRRKRRQALRAKNPRQEGAEYDIVTPPGETETGSAGKQPVKG